MEALGVTCFKLFEDISCERETLDLFCVTTKNTIKDKE